jgi:hypothetical protein
MDNLVEPRDASATPEMATPAPDMSAANAAQPSASEAPPSLPETLLKIPAIQGLMAGTPPAVSAPIKEFSKRGDAKLLIENKDLLLQAGFNLYRSLNGETGVLYNTLHIHGDALKQADAAGQLRAIAPSFDEINHKLGKAGVQHPIFNAQVPAGPVAPPIMTPPQGNAMPMPAVSVASTPAPRKAVQAKMASLAPTAPTAGAVPGQGALLRSILKPVV